MKKYGSDPMKGGGNSGKSGGSKSKTNHGSSGSITKSNEMRGDMTKHVSNKNPYPGGLC